MQRALSLATAVSILAFAAAGCGGSGSNTVATTTTATTRPVSSAQAVFSLDQVGLGPNGYVTLTNFTDQPQSLGGLVMCQGADCASLPAVNVAAGKRVRVAMGDGKGVASVVVRNVHLGELRQEDGEIAVYANGTAAHPRDIVTYLEWGSTPHQRTAEAVRAGLWLKTAYAPTAPNAATLYRKSGGLWLFTTKR